MKISYQQLATHLSKHIHPIYLIHSNESLLVQEAIDLISERAKEKGFVERIAIDVQGKWEDALFAEINSLSLFASQRIILLRLGTHKPNAAAAKILEEITKLPLEHTLLIITANQLDAKTESSKWVRAIEKNAMVVQIWPVTKELLPQWILARAKQKKVNITAVMAEFLAEQSEGNLLAASQEIEKLSLLNEMGTDVHATSTDNASFTIFNLVESTLIGDKERSLRILHCLRNEGSEPILILWALAKELRLLCELAFQLKRGSSLPQLFTQHRIWEKRQKPIRQFLNKTPLAKCWSLLQQAARIDRIIKGIEPGNSWQSLEILSLQMVDDDIMTLSPSKN